VTVDDLVGVQRVVTGLPGRHVVWRVAGSGPPLVLLHGGYGSWTHWYRNVRPMAEHATVLVPDMPGYGESDDPQDLDDHRSIAAPVLDGIDELVGRNARFAIAAFSFGGNVAGEIGLRAASRLETLVLVGAGGLRLPRPPSVDLTSWRNLPTSAAQNDAHRDNLVRFMLHDPAVADRETVALQANNAAQARIRSRPISRRAPLHDALPMLDTRLHGIWGEEDVTAKGYLAEREALLRQNDPLSSFATIPRAGHWVQYEAAEKVNRCLRILITRQPTA
jgi:2-hydroxy-6-oxonona-2,4-dienedioate hydrolase